MKVKINDITTNNKGEVSMRLDITLHWYLDKEQITSLKEIFKTADYYESFLKSQKQDTATISGPKI